MSSRALIRAGGLALLSTILLNPATAELVTGQAELVNWCQDDPRCGSPDLGWFNGLADTNGNGIQDVYESFHSVSLNIELDVPDGQRYVPDADGILELVVFGDLDSGPLPPDDPAQLRADEHYDVEWMDVSAEGFEMGRILNGNLADDLFNMGVPEGWWPDGYDRGTLWGIAKSPLSREGEVSGTATIPRAELARLIRDGKLTLTFALAADHQDLTHHPHFAPPREEYIRATLRFEGHLEPVDGPPQAQIRFTPAEPVAGADVQFDGSGSSDSDGHVVAWQWTTSDGQQASGPQVRFRFAAAGSHSVTLQVTDDDGKTGSATVTVPVREAVAPPPDGGAPDGDGGGVLPRCRP